MKQHLAITTIADQLIHVDLTSMIQNNNVKEIAKMFNTTIYIIEGALSKQIILKHFRMTNVFTVVDEMDLDCNGEWGKLKESNIYKHLKQTI